MGNPELTKIADRLDMLCRLLQDLIDSYDNVNVIYSRTNRIYKEYEDPRFKNYTKED